MSKEIIQVLEHSQQESSDSCPRCGNPLVPVTENNTFYKKCITESFDLKTETITKCGFEKMVPTL